MAIDADRGLDVPPCGITDQFDPQATLPTGMGDELIAIILRRHPDILSDLSFEGRLEEALVHYHGPAALQTDITSHYIGLSQRIQEKRTVAPLPILMALPPADRYHPTFRQEITAFSLVNAVNTVFRSTRRTEAPSRQNLLLDGEIVHRRLALLGRTAVTVGNILSPTYVSSEISRGEEIVLAESVHVRGQMVIDLPDAPAEDKKHTDRLSPHIHPRIYVGWDEVGAAFTDLLRRDRSEAAVFRILDFLSNTDAIPWIAKELPRLAHLLDAASDIRTLLAQDELFG